MTPLLILLVAALTVAVLFAPGVPPWLRSIGQVLVAVILLGIIAAVSVMVDGAISD